jgi:hypothetical protein
MYLHDETVANRRSGFVGPEFVPFKEAAKDLGAYETWSSLCLGNLETLLSKAAQLGVAPR